MGYRGEGYTSSGYDDRGDRYREGHRDGGYGAGFDDAFDSSAPYDAAPYEDARRDAAYDRATYNSAPDDGARYDGSAYDGPAYDSASYDGSPYEGSSYEEARRDGARRDGAAYDGSRYDSAAYNSPSGGYRTRGSAPDGSISYGGPGYDSATYDSPSGGYRTRGGGSRSGGYPAASDSGSFARPSYVSGGYPTFGHPSGGYATQPGDSEFSDPFADGNDWYGGHGGAHRDTFDTSTHLALPDDPAPSFDPAPALRERNLTRHDQPALGDDFDPPSPPRPSREFGQALQGDEFDGGIRDDYDGFGTRERPAGTSTPDWDEPEPRPARNRPADDPPRRKRRGRAVWVTLLVLVILAGGGFAGYKFLLKGKSASPSALGVNQALPTVAPASATAQCVKELGQFCHIELRSQDPAPLTLDEAYPPAFFSKADNANFTRVADKADTDCSKAVVGNSQFLGQLKAGGCNQALRASYVSGDNKIMGTIGVLNLASTNQAHYAGRYIGGTNLILPLPTSKGVAAKLGQGKGLVMAEYKGHYLIIVWAQFANLAAPDTTALTQQLQQFENTVIAGTANIILSQRMIDGDTAQTAPSASATPSAKPSASAKASASASAG